MQHWDKSGAVMKLSDVLCESGPESRHCREDGARSPRHTASRGLSLTVFRSPGPGNVQIRDGDFGRKTCCWEKWSANVTLLQWENVWVEFTASSYLPSAPSCKHSNCWFTGLFRALWCIGHFVHVLWLEIVHFWSQPLPSQTFNAMRKTENGQKCNDNWCQSWWLPSRSKWYPLVLRSNWKSLGWIIKIRLHFIISPQPCCLRDQVRCWCYTQLKADTKTGIIFLSVALWMDIKGINQLCRIRKRIIDFSKNLRNKTSTINETSNNCVKNCGDCRIFLASCEFTGQFYWQRFP